MRKISAWTETKGEKVPGVVEDKDVAKYLGVARISPRQTARNGVGVATRTTTCWSPRTGRPTSGRPFPARRKTSPGWVPSGRKRTSFPSSVGTSTLPPRAAFAKEMVT